MKLLIGYISEVGSFINKLDVGSILIKFWVKYVWLSLCESIDEVIVRVLSI